MYKIDSIKFYMDLNSIIGGAEQRTRTDLQRGRAELIEQILRLATEGESIKLLKFVSNTYNFSGQLNEMLSYFLSLGP